MHSVPIPPERSLNTTRPALPELVDAVLLDLGNVILGVDFLRVFEFWGREAGEDPRELARRFRLDAAYERHETGHLEFAEYVRHLEHQLEIQLPLETWHTGWNEVFVGPYHRVGERLAELEGRLPLYAFTNTNPTHHRAWQGRYAGLLHPLRRIYVSSELGLRKPHRQAFQHVVDDMGIAPSRVLFLDDTLENVHGAAATGLSSVHVSSEDEVVAVLEALLDALL